MSTTMNVKISRALGAFVLIAASGSLSSCRSSGDNADPTVWTQEFKSPDGAWIATATTRQWGGFGSAWVETSVSLKTTGTKYIVDDNKEFHVFSYPGGKIVKAYTLDSHNADTDLAIRWTSPHQLHIAHSSPVDPDLIVLRRSEVDVFYQKGSFTLPTER